MLAAAVAYLRCPSCASPVCLGGRNLVCDRGHSFDIARHGYANLTAGRAGPGTADTTAMVEARERFLSGGHYQPLAAAVRSLAAQYDRGPGLAIDLAGGTGYYLARILEAPIRSARVCALTCRSRPAACRPGAPAGSSPRRGRVAASPARSPLGGRGAEHLRATQRRRERPHPDP